MAEQPQTRAQGPGKGGPGYRQRIVTIMVAWWKPGVRLAVIELEEEKANLIQLLMMAGLTLLFTAFGLMSLLILIFWAIDPAYRLMALVRLPPFCCSWPLWGLSGHCPRLAVRHC
ncbi:Inner membrane protein yqjE [Serratia fonticola]|uniref:Inner membrane protein yqjE n=1 Tax=Serratia fonticola TaxID=47917 RepID=A0A4U9W8B2_SERFO|nr:Inner membrane protein yqjE [Serratia fonticola]